MILHQFCTCYHFTLSCINWFSFLATWYVLCIGVLLTLWDGSMIQSKKENCNCTVTVQLPYESQVMDIIIFASQIKFFQLKNHYNHGDRTFTTCFLTPGEQDFYPLACLQHCSALSLCCFVTYFSFVKACSVLWFG